MLTPSSMSRVVITGPKSIQEDIIKELHSLKILHIVDHTKSELADIGNPLESAAKLSEILVKVRSLISLLGVKKEDYDFELKKGMLEIQSTAKKLSDELNVNLDEIKKIDETLSRNELIRQELDILKGINIALEALSSYKSLAYFAGYLKGKNGHELLKGELEETTAKFMLLQNPTSKGNLIILFIDTKNKDSAISIMQKIGFNPVNFLNLSGLKGLASNNIRKLDEDTVRFIMKKDEIGIKLGNLRNNYSSFLLASEDFLKDQLEKAEAPLKFASTKSSFLVKGWVPSDGLNKSIDRLNKVSKNRIFVQFEPAKKSDKVPVKLKNNRYSKPFEFFLDLYSMPTYKEIDPTFFIFLTFPILFGMMLGDIGYGLVSFLIFWILKMKMPKARNLMNILILASLVSVLFGILFGEFFGLEKIGNIELWHLISREKEMFTLMYLAIGIGVVHLNGGLIIGFINELRAHGFRHAFFGKVSWFVLETGIVFIALSIFKKIIISWVVGAAIIFLSLIMLFIGEGVKGPIESLSIITNALSYARLMAIGLSSVILAAIINDESGQFFHKGGLFIFAGVLVLVVGHAINLMLGLLGSFLHSLRLHYVEFFSKFFHGGAEKYNPFGMGG